MEILINKNNAGEFIREANKILLKLYFNKAINVLLLVLLFGVILTLEGIQKGHQTSISTSESYDNNFSKIITTTRVFNFHFWFDLGIAFIALFLFLLQALYMQNRQFFFNITNKGKRLELSNDTFILKVDDKGVFYQDFEVTTEMKWSNFVNYKIYKEYLFLFSGYSLSTAVPISMNQIKNEELQELLKFVKSRLMERK